jgi:hypothetical protein
MNITLPSTAAVAFLAIAALQPSPGLAQTRVFVSAHGADSNACTPAAPCRTFQHAHDVVAANGEIDVLDPAGYGVVNITKAISIQGHGFSGISANGDYAIFIQAGASDVVNLRGLLIDGGGTGIYGVEYISGILNLQDCVIRRFQDSNILLEGPSAYLSNSVLSDNNDNGATIAPNQTSHVTFNRMEIVGNGINGLQIAGDRLPNGAVAWVSVNDSVIAGNSLQGILANNLRNPNLHSFITVMVTRSSIVDGLGAGILAQGTCVVIQLNQSTIANNASGWSTTNGGAVTTYGNNVLSDNGAAGDNAPAPATLK